jgi:hypothetical protein
VSYLRRKAMDAPVILATLGPIRRGSQEERQQARRACARQRVKGALTGAELLQVLDMLGLQEANG